MNASSRSQLPELGKNRASYLMAGIIFSHKMALLFRANKRVDWCDSKAITFFTGVGHAPICLDKTTKSYSSA